MNHRILAEILRIIHLALGYPKSVHCSVYHTHKYQGLRICVGALSPCKQFISVSIKAEASSGWLLTCHTRFSIHSSLYNFPRSKQISTRRLAWANNHEIKTKTAGVLIKFMTCHVMDSCPLLYRRIQWCRTVGDGKRDLLNCWKFNDSCMKYGKVELRSAWYFVVASGAVLPQLNFTRINKSVIKITRTLQLGQVLRSSDSR